MRRRDFIAILGSAAAAWPPAAHAQQAVMPVIGFLGGETSDLTASRLRAFRQGLREAGFVEGQNVAIEYRWAEGYNERLPALANELVHRQVTVIAAAGLPAAQAAKGASATIPIVFYVSVDPVEFRLVASLNWPRGNLSGITGLNAQLLPKRLEILHELMPEAKNFALLVNESNPNSGPTMIEMMGAARALGLRLHLFYACTESEITEAFISLSQLKADALVIGNDSLFVYRSESLGALTLRHAIPTIHEFRPFVASGGLLSYGSSITDSYRLAGVYTSRILKGEKPADLPVQQSTKVEMIINVKTAKALGLTIPPTLLATADEVIE